MEVDDRWSPKQLTALGIVTLGHRGPRHRPHGDAPHDVHVFRRLAARTQRKRDHAPVVCHDPRMNVDVMERPLAERLLAMMDQKDHWAWQSLTRPGLRREQLLVHFQHEYLVYVRDFPALLARALGQTPPIQDVRAALAENVYEEQTGGISRSGPHPELFLCMMQGLGFGRGALRRRCVQSASIGARAIAQMLRDAAARRRGRRRSRCSRSSSREVATSARSSRGRSCARAEKTP